MSPFVFFTILCAALLHAGWNALLKSGQNKQSLVMVLSVGQAIVGLAVVIWLHFVIWLPFPKGVVWFWLLASGIIHMLYQVFLAYAYEQGDLSRVYPISRGTAPFLVLLISIVFLTDVTDVISAHEYIGIFLLGGGVAMMALGALRSGENWKLVPYALATAVATAGYSVVDGLGARISGDAISYVGWLVIISGCLYMPTTLWLRGPNVFILPAKEWIRGFIAAFVSMIAYTVVVWAMSHAPIALVVALRETSILFAVVIGWLFLGDKLDVGKICAAILIVAGIILTRI